MGLAQALRDRRAGRIAAGAPDQAAATDRIADRDRTGFSEPFVPEWRRRALARELPAVDTTSLTDLVV